jgi:hypothetical protein
VSSSRLETFTLGNDSWVLTGIDGMMTVFMTEAIPPIARTAEAAAAILRNSRLGSSGSFSFSCPFKARPPTPFQVVSVCQLATK